MMRGTLAINGGAGRPEPDHRQRTPHQSGLMPEWSRNPTSDFHFVECGTPEDAAGKILDIVLNRIPARFGLDPVRDIQVL